LHTIVEVCTFGVQKAIKVCKDCNYTYDKIKGTYDKIKGHPKMPYFTWVLLMSIIGARTNTLLDDGDE
jgi:hypothetical protein